MKGYDFRWMGYIFFGSGIASLARMTGDKWFGYDVSTQVVQGFGAFFLVLGSAWLARTDDKTQSK